MKIFLSLILCLCFAYAEGEKKDVNFDDLFSQLDKVITAKKDKNIIKKEETKFRTESTSEREKNYKNFNEAAKKYHIFRAENILKTVNVLIKEYESKASQSINVQRYTRIGSKSFAYVSSKELNVLITKLEADGKNLNDLKNYERLLLTIKDYDIKTIAKVLIIVEQKVMNLRGVGLKKLIKKKSKIETVTAVKLIKNKVINQNIKVIREEKNQATLRFISS
jgi:hypothetical protein